MSWMPSEFHRRVFERAVCRSTLTCTAATRAAWPPRSLWGTARVCMCARVNECSSVCASIFSPSWWWSYRCCCSCCCYCCSFCCCCCSCCCCCCYPFYRPEPTKSIHSHTHTHTHIRTTRGFPISLCVPRSRRLLLLTTTTMTTAPFSLLIDNVASRSSLNLPERPASA